MDIEDIPIPQDSPEDFGMVFCKICGDYFWWEDGCPNVGEDYHVELESKLQAGAK